MKYAVEMDSFATIYIPSFRKFSSDIQKLFRWHMDTQAHIHTDRMEITTPALGKQGNKMEGLMG
jgi:hypothetical protein